MKSKILKILRENSTSSTDRVVKLLNSLEFKNDVLKLGGNIYAVGGIVRDALMNKESDDLDIVVQGIPYDILFKILSKYGTPTDTSNDNDENKDFGATKFVSHNPKFNAILSNNGVDKVIDVMLPRKDAKDVNVQGHKGIKSDVNHNYTIQDDLERRDITINAIAVALDGTLIDKGGQGMEDIKNGVIRAVSEDSFIEDPLRMVRAIRFAGRFNYDIDEATLNLIRNNAEMLSNKEELPAERFLMEFEKMIGKTDLGRAVKLLVDMGMYKAIFGVDSKITDYDKFDKANSIGEFAYMLFEEQVPGTIQELVFDNITNDTDINNYVKALVAYVNQLRGKDIDFVKEINALATLYKLSPDMLLNSNYVEDNHRQIAQDFMDEKIPKGDHDIAFKGADFLDFAREMIIQEFGKFTKADGRKLGAAKNLALQGIYGGKVQNEPEAIKQYLIDNSSQWLN